MGRWEPDAENRLRAAAIELFGEIGYEQTTVAAIAERAGLTARTFFRYFADKREVLFMGSAELQDRWVTAVRDAPARAGAMEAVDRGLDAVAELFGERHAFARVRARVIAANPFVAEWTTTIVFFSHGSPVCLLRIPPQRSTTFSPR